LINKTIKDVAIYLRLSREQGDTQDSLYIHRKTLIEFCEKNDYRYTIYEEVSSGMNDEREQLDLLLSKLEHYEAIVCMDLDRLTRNDVFAMKIKSILILHEIVILTPGATYNLAEENADLLYSIKSLLANQEYKQIRKRLTRGKFAHAKEGKWVVNKVPLGYNKDSNKILYINEDEAKIIRLIFQRLNEGHSIHSLTKELDMLGIRSRNGKVLTSSHISQIRNNPVYYGVVQYKMKNEFKQVIDECFIEGAHVGIVSKEDWLNAQQSKHSAKGMVQKSKPKTPLHHLIYCAICGRKRSITEDKRHGFFIKSCGSKIANNRCDDVGMKLYPIQEEVMKEVKTFLKGKLIDQIERFQSSNFTEEMNTINTELEMIKRRLDKFSKRMLGLKTMRADGELSKSEFNEMKNTVENDSIKLKERQSLLNIKLDKLSDTDGQINKALETINQIDMLDQLKVEEVNAFMHTVLKKVYFARNMKISDNINPYNRYNLEEDVNITLEFDWYI